MSQQVEFESQDDSNEIPGWVGARTAWGFLAASVACLAAVILLDNSIADWLTTLLIGSMMGLGLIAASAGIVWFRSAGRFDDPSSQRLGAAIAVICGSLLFALPLLVFLWVMLFFEGQ